MLKNDDKVDLSEIVQSPGIPQGKIMSVVLGRNYSFKRNKLFFPLCQLYLTSLPPYSQTWPESLFLNPLENWPKVPYAALGLTLHLFWAPLLSFSSYFFFFLCSHQFLQETLPNTSLSQESLSQDLPVRNTNWDKYTIRMQTFLMIRIIKLDCMKYYSVRALSRYIIT